MNSRRDAFCYDLAKTYNNRLLIRSDEVDSRKSISSQNNPSPATFQPGGQHPLTGAEKISRAIIIVVMMVLITMKVMMLVIVMMVVQFEFQFCLPFVSSFSNSESDDRMAVVFGSITFL